MALGEAWEAMTIDDALHMVRIMRKGAWLSMIPSTVNGTDLGAQEWRDPLFL